MSEFLSAAASALGLPEPIVERSAGARAAETGASVDDILKAWAGGEEIASQTPPAEGKAQAAGPDAEEQVAFEEPTPEPAAAAPAAGVLETATPPPARAPTRAPLPDRVTLAEATRLPVVITVPTAGIKERTNFAIPKWLTAVLVVAPFFALFALGGSATGQCGEATELSTDVVTGEIVNCDGSEFTGQAVGGGGTDFIALGEGIYAGAEVTGVNCAGCHGTGGQGVGAFPGLTGVLNTFGACTDHIEWVIQGSAGFQAMGLTSYGDTGKTISGGMPGFSANLSAEQIAAVVAFERVRFSGGEPEAVLADCGLLEPEVGGGEDGTGGEDGDMGEAEGEASAATR